MRKWTIPTDEEILAQIPAAEEATRSALDNEPHAKAARYDRQSGKFVVDLLNGTTFIFPAELVEELRSAAAEQLSEVSVTPLGDGLHWETLDVDLGVSSLLAGIFGSTAWMARIRSELAKQAGSTSSEAKARAARENGKKGGRPKKHAQS